MVLPDPDDPRWWADPTGPSRPAPVEPSAEQRREQQLERFRRQRALEARLAAGGTGRQPSRARGAWGTAAAPDGAYPGHSSDRQARRRPTLLRLLGLAVVTALLGSGAILVVGLVLSGTNPLDRLSWGDSATGWADEAPTEVPPEFADGWGDDGTTDRGDDPIVEQVDLAPPAQAAPVDPTPLGAPPPMPAQPGNYRFISFQPGSDQPVAYDPCRPIRYLVNTVDAPDGADQMVAQALGEVTAATGLVFEFVGATDETPSTGRETVRADNGAWPPVIIGWINPQVEPELAGNVAGLAGSVQLEVSTTTSSSTGETVEQAAFFVTGTVALDGPQIADLVAGSPDGLATGTAVVKHEVAHLVGLDHVDDPSEIMNPTGSPDVTRFGPGDLRGLNHLGRGRCAPAG